MSEFMYDKEKYIEECKKIIFENNTDSIFGVETGIVFHKSGLYDVDISNNHVVVSKVDERKAIDDSYQKGLEEGKKQAKVQAHLDVCHDIERVAHGNYQKGLDDAWKTIIKIALIPYVERSETFDGQQDILSIMQKFSPSEVTAKLREYEQQKADAEINVGDEVRSKVTGSIGTVIKSNVGGDPDYIYLLYDDGSMGKYLKSEYRKTGRHFHYVEKLLNEMRGDED